MTLKGMLKGIIRPTTAVFGLSLLVASGIFQAALAQEGNKRVYRWVDENGDVHYSETLPPNWEGETHDELGHDGIVRDEGVSRKPPPPPPKDKPDPATAKAELPRDKSGLKRPEPLYSDSEKQQRMDRLLLLRYQSEEELLEARDVEVNQLKYDERLLTATHESLKASLRSNIVLAGHSQRAGIEVKPETLQKIANIRSRLEQNTRSLRGLKIREENIRSTFDEQLERYRELVELYSEEES